MNKYNSRVLATLLKNGSRTNRQLNRICLRYGARIYDLRQVGWNITTTNLGKGRFRFTLSA